MNPLYIFLERLTKKLELQADLDVVNKLLIVYFVNFTGIVINLFFAILALISGNNSLAIFLFSTSAALNPQSAHFSFYTATEPEQNIPYPCHGCCISLFVAYRGNRRIGTFLAPVVSRIFHTAFWNQAGECGFIPVFCGCGALSCFSVAAECTASLQFRLVIAG